MTGLYIHRGKGRNPSKLMRPFGLIALGMMIVGCGTTLEDGYKPKALGSTPEVRKSYYASPFTPQAEAGSHDAAPAVHAGGR